MNAIYIPQLAKAFEQTETLQIRNYLPNLETLTPVQGVINVTHRGTFLDVKAKAEAIVTLTCDRCLQQYNHRVTVDTSEFIWLQEPISDWDQPLEQEGGLDDLVETLDPQGYFNPDEWLYEQFCLAMPQRQLCNEECEGMQPQQSQPTIPPTVDRRWASLEQLKNQLSN